MILVVRDSIDKVYNNPIVLTSGEIPETCHDMFMRFYQNVEIFILTNANYLAIFFNLHFHMPMFGENG